MAENILVLGANSGIAQALCRRLAQRGCRLLLAGRRDEALVADAQALRAAFAAEVATLHFDALAYDTHPALFQEAVEWSGGNLDTVILCHGVLPEHFATEHDLFLARQTFEINFVSAVSLLSLAANYFAARRTGCIAAISSVAGDFGIYRNYNYAASKAALNVWLQGLRNRLYRENVRVLTIKPGLTATPMIAHLVRPGFIPVATADRVARDIDRALLHRAEVLYTPWFWRGIMSVLCALPDSLAKRLRL